MGNRNPLADQMCLLGFISNNHTQIVYNKHNNQVSRFLHPREVTLSFV